MMWWDDGGWSSGGWLAMLLMMVLFWGGLIALVVWLIQTVRPDRDRPRPPSQVEPSHAEELLAERFARGEIDEEEFTRRRTLLRSG